MKLIDKIARLPLRPEILALLEKIDSIESEAETSYPFIYRLITEERGFGFYERMTLKRALAKIAQRGVYARVMSVVIGDKLPESWSLTGALVPNPFENILNRKLAAATQKQMAAMQQAAVAQKGLAGMPVPHTPLETVLTRKKLAVQKQILAEQK